MKYTMFQHYLHLSPRDDILHRMKAVHLLALLASIAILAAPRVPPPKDALHWNRMIDMTVNLGNALEAPEEGKWGVRLEEEYFKLIADAGFAAVRIPVRWSAHAAKEAPFTIDKTFFDRVDWAVKQALSRKLTAIVNVHHYEEMGDAPDAHRERFLALWQQIAEHYRGFDDALFFELMNEPCKKITSDWWNALVAETIRVIRKDHPARAIVVGPVDWNSIGQLKNLKLPPDDKNLIVTFHYYQPFHFTHQGAEWVGKESVKWLGTPWSGSDAEKAAVRKDLDEAAQWAKGNGRPLFMGEFGAYNKAEMSSRERWTAFVRSEAEKRNFSWAYWEFCAGFGIYDPKSKEWRKGLRVALIPTPSR